MTESDRDENSLEQRLRDHYQHRYAQPPDPRLIWTHVQPQLGHEENIWPEQPRQKKGLVGLAESLVARRKTAFKLKREEDIPMESANQEQTAQNALPMPLRLALSPRRRMQHAIEIIAAVILVAVLVIGWAAIGHARSSQGTDTPLFTYTSQPGESTYSLQWTPDGKYLTFVLQSDNLFRYRFLTWNPATGAVKQTLSVTLPAGNGGSFDLSPDGQYVVIVISAVSASKPGTIELANTLTGKTEQIYQVRGEEGNAQVAFSHDNKDIAFIGDDERIHVWNIAAHKIITVSAPTGSPNTDQIIWSQDDKNLLTENFAEQRPNTVQIWNAQTGHSIESITETPTMWILSPVGDVNQAGLSPDLKRLLTYNYSTKMLDIRETSTLNIVRSFPVELIKNGQISSAGYLEGGIFNFPDWLANGKRIFLEYNGVDHVWNTETGQSVTTFSGLDDPNTFVGIQIWASGRYAFFEQKNVLQIWDLLTGTKIRTITMASHPFEVHWLDSGNDLSILYNFGSADEYGEIYDALSGKLIATYQGGDQADLSSNGKYLASANDVRDPKDNDRSILDSIIRVQALQP